MTPERAITCLSAASERDVRTCQTLKRWCWEVEITESTVSSLVSLKKIGRCKAFPVLPLSLVLVQTLFGGLILGAPLKEFVLCVCVCGGAKVIAKHYLFLQLFEWLDLSPCFDRQGASVPPSPPHPRRFHLRQLFILKSQRVPGRQRLVPPVCAENQSIRVQRPPTASAPNTHTHRRSHRPRSTRLLILTTPVLSHLIDIWAFLFDNGHKKERCSSLLAHTHLLQYFFLFRRDQASVSISRLISEFLKPPAVALTRWLQRLILQV